MRFEARGVDVETGKTVGAILEADDSAKARADLESAGISVETIWPLHPDVQIRDFAKGGPDYPAARTPPE